MPDYALGVPMWVDVASPDMEKSKSFYSQLFGWEAHTMPDPQAGGYTLFLLNGKMAAALGPTMSPEQPAAWSTYVHTRDAAATADAVKAAGGHVVVDPMQVMDQGTMGVFTDPQGAFISVWQPAKHQGAEVANDPNSFVWNELNTRDVDGAKAFYKKVFNWDSKTEAFNGGTYTQFMVGDRSIAGMMDMTNMVPAEVPPHWLVYFTAEDVDKTAAKAKGLGATLLHGPADVGGMGRFAVIQDPVGAVFASMTFTPQQG